MDANRVMELEIGKRKSRVVLDRSERFAVFDFQYNYSEKEYVKKTLRARFKKEPRPYWFLNLMELKPQALDRYRAAFHADVSPELLARLTEIHGAYDKALALSGAPDNSLDGIDWSGFAFELLPFQRADVAYSLMKRRVLNANDMGLGKTVESLATLYAAKRLDRFLIVCPATIKINWQRAILEMCGLEILTEIWDAKTGSGHSGVNGVIINYENLVKRGADLKRFAPSAIIIDEAHYAKSETAQRTKALMELVRGVDWLQALTGTPIQNRPKELIALLKLLGCMEEFGGWFTFARRYCAAYKQRLLVRSKKNPSGTWREILNMDGAQNLEELNVRLREVCMIRRKKTEVLSELPSKRRARIVLEIDNRKDYDAASASLINYLMATVEENAALKKELSFMTPEERRETLKRVRAERRASAERAEQLVFFETATQIAARGKLKAVIDWVDNFLSSGEKFVLYYYHVEFAEALSKAFPRAARIRGGDGAALQQANVDRFVHESQLSCPLMIASIMSGGVGIDRMQNAASNLGFLELADTPATHLQAEDRLWRYGQEDKVTVYYFIAENTVEENIQQMLATKQAICDSALDGAPFIASGSVFNELIDEMIDNLSGAPDKKRRAK